jgi:hypothetical protein
MAQVLECLLSMRETLNSNPSAAKKIKKKRNMIDCLLGACTGNGG